MIKRNKTIKKGTKIVVNRDFWSYDDYAKELSPDYDQLIKYKKEWVGTILSRDLNAEELRDSDKMLTDEERKSKCYMIRFRDKDKNVTRWTGLFDNEFTVVKKRKKK